MNTRRTPRTRSSISAGALLIAMAFAGISCTAVVDVSTTRGTASTNPADTVPTTTTRKAMTAEDLDALLPTAEEVGNGYELVPEVDGEEDADDAGDPFTAALEESCPEFAQLESADEGDDEGVQREFSTSDDRNISVEIGFASSKEPDLDELETTLAALKKCGEVKFKSDGFDYKVELSGRRDDVYGDAAARLKMRITMSGGELPDPIVFETTIYSAQVGILSVQVSATSGLDEDRSLVPADIDVLEEVMDLTAARAAVAQ